MDSTTKEKVRNAKIEMYAREGAGISYIGENEATPEMLLRHLFEYKIVSRFARGRVLDAGAGYGRISIPLAAFRQVVALDSSKDMLECIERTRSNPINPEVILGYVENLPFQDKSFDTVISMRVLVHLPNYEKILDEYFRVLRTGGYLIFDVATNHRPLFRKVLRKILLKPNLPQNDIPNDPSKFSNKLPFKVIKRVIEERGGVIEYRYPFSLLRTVFFDNGFITRKSMNSILQNRFLFGLVRFIERGLTHIVPVSFMPYCILVVKKNT